MWMKKFMSSTALSRTLFYQYPILSPALPRIPFNFYSQISISSSSSSSSFPTHIKEASPRLFLCQMLHFPGGNICSPSGKYFCTVSTEKLKCWNCNSEASRTHPFLVCEVCASIQHVDESIDYFQIFGLEKKYDIECRNLEHKYKDWQRKLHPDLVHTKSEKEKEFAAEQSARVIDAYHTLSNSLSRAKYLVKLEGWFVDEEERILDPELLAEIMEIRETIDESADPQALKHIKAQVQEKYEERARAFALAFENRNAEEALSSIQKMAYYKRAVEEIVKKQ